MYYGSVFTATGNSGWQVFVLSSKTAGGWPRQSRMRAKHDKAYCFYEECEGSLWSGANRALGAQWDGTGASMAQMEVASLLTFDRDLEEYEIRGIVNFLVDYFEDIPE